MFLTQRTRSVLAVLVSTAGIATTLANQITGPSSSQSPYVVRAQPGVVTMSVLTVGDSVNLKPDGTPYRLVGIPDGLGAYDNEDGTFTLLVNHELGATAGTVRAHGAKGSFISKWIIDKETLQVIVGEDLIQRVWTWDGSAYVALNPPAPLGRLCSADLPKMGAFYDEDSGRGYAGRIFMNGEEAGSEGRAFAHLMTGETYELPWLGKFSWENSVAHPEAGRKTVVVGLDDSSGGQVYVYVGEKTQDSHPVVAAGLTHGKLYGLKVAGFPDEVPATGIPSGTPFSLVEIPDVAGKTGAQLDAESKAAFITGFQRLEDGAWDPQNLKHFYFVTTASFTGNSRLWRLRFHDPENPELGGSIDMLLNGTEGPKMMDNLTITERGSIFIQEDPGNQTYLAKIWRYSIRRDTVSLVAEHDPDRFLPGTPNFLTADEESSGIIPVDDILGEGWYLLDVQAHYRNGDPELVEGGQITAIFFPPGREK